MRLFLLLSFASIALLGASLLLPSSTSPCTFVHAGLLEDLLAEGTDMLSGQAARDQADLQLREAKKTRKNPESCEEFKCPKSGHIARHREGFLPESNGCGSYGLKIHSQWHTPCCDVHDKCYGTCGKSRNDCDSEFKKCMARQCKKYDAKKAKKQREDCEGQAQMFFTGTRSLVCQAYLDSQKEACVCSLKDAVKKVAGKVAAAAKAVEDKLEL
jgi:hypothetical protein